MNKALFMYHFFIVDVVGVRKRLFLPSKNLSSAEAHGVNYWIRQ